MSPHGITWLGLFRRLMLLFPAGYRAQFGVEQLETLEMALADTTPLGRAVLAWLWLNELVSLPGAILRAHLRERRGIVFTSPANPFVEKPASWGAALLTGLPHLLWGLAAYLPLLIASAGGPHLDALIVRWGTLVKSFPPAWWALQTISRPSYWLPQRVFYQSVQWGFVLLVVVCLVIAWRRGWPRWSASWLGYGLLVLFVGLITVFPDGWIAYPMGVLWVALALGVYIWQARRSLLAGMLAVLPFTHMFWWQLMIDGIKGTNPEAIGYIAAGLLLMLAVTAAMRSGRLAFGLGMVLTVTLVVGLGFSYGGVYHSNAPMPPDPTPGGVTLGTLTGLAAFALYGLPFWLILLWRWRKQRLAG